MHKHNYFEKLQQLRWMIVEGFHSEDDTYHSFRFADYHNGSSTKLGRLKDVCQLLDIGEHYNHAMGLISSLTILGIVSSYPDSSLTRIAFDPYHHLAHTENICLNAFEGLQYMLRAERQTSEELAETTFKLNRDIVLAGLYHDVGHSFGALPDSENVAVAARHYEEALEMFPNDSDDLWSVRDLILATEWPHKPMGSNVSESHKILIPILRDADMMSSYVRDVGQLERIFVGLFLESKLKFPDLTLEEFIANQQAFGSGVQWCTLWGSRKARNLEWEMQPQRVATVVKSSTVLLDLAQQGVITL